MSKNVSAYETAEALIRERFKKVFTQSGLSGKEFCELTGLDTGYFSRMLNKKFNPSIAMLLKICDVLQFDLDLLLFGNNIPDIRIPRNLGYVLDCAYKRDYWFTEVERISKEQKRDIGLPIEQLVLLRIGEYISNDFEKRGKLLSNECNSAAVINLVNETNSFYDALRNDNQNIPVKMTTRSTGTLFEFCHMFGISANYLCRQDYAVRSNDLYYIDENSEKVYIRHPMDVGFISDLLHISEPTFSSLISKILLDVKT